MISAQWTYEHALGAVHSSVPTVVTFHDTPLRYAWIINHVFSWYHVSVAWRVICRAHHLVCVSPYTAQYIQRLFFPRGSVDVVPHGLTYRNLLSRMVGV